MSDGYRAAWLRHKKRVGGGLTPQEERTLQGCEESLDRMSRPPGSPKPKGTGTPSPTPDPVLFFGAILFATIVALQITLIAKGGKAPVISSGKTIVVLPSKK